MSSDATMSDSDLDKEVVYLAYRDIFKGQLAKLRKPRRVHNVVKKHKDHLHHKQLADSMSSEKACKILGDLLAGGLFESDSVAEATFPTLFSPGAALIVKCVEDHFEPGGGQRDGNNPGAPPSWMYSVLPTLLCQMALP
jgi:L-ascorbate metabolism protein UlaG (beta-lactamase superfamily)